MIKAARMIGGASLLVTGFAGAALAGEPPAAGMDAIGGAGPLPYTTSSAATTAGNGTAASGKRVKRVRLENFRGDGRRGDGRRRDEQHLRKRQWHEYWDNRFDVWDLRNGRKVLIGQLTSEPGRTF